MSDPLYRDHILTHYYAPTHYGLAADFDIEVRRANPLCGDSMVLRLKFSGENIGGISFESVGCVLSRAAASILSEYIEEKSRQELRSLTTSQMLALFGVPVTPVRVGCVTLPLEALQGAL